MAALSQITNTAHLVNFRDMEGCKLLHYLLDPNWGLEPGILKNGLDVFTVIEPLLRKGADPCAHNSMGETPLMQAARRSLRFLCTGDETLSCEEACTRSSRFLKRWLSVLRSCGVDLENYHRWEQDSGASDFTPCTWFYEVSHPLACEWDWSVRARFEVGGRGSQEDLHVEFEYEKGPEICEPSGSLDRYLSVKTISKLLSAMAGFIAFKFWTFLRSPRCRQFD
jgi:hypothetical protein